MGKRVKIGIVGLGRLGKHHAENLAWHTKDAALVAACSLVQEELDWAHDILGINALYQSYEEMLDNEKLDAVWIASSSAQHQKQIVQALDHGLHVFSEKPMGVNVAECKIIERATQLHPESKFMIGFVRRFDPSYVYAKELVERGVIGTPFLVRSQTVDMDTYAAFQVKFVPSSGGIFLDMNIHDIDLARWYLEDEVASVYAIGGSYVHPEFETVNDADNTAALLKFKKGSMAILSVSRTAFHGHDTHTEITGSKGILKIGHTPSKNRVEILDVDGVRTECVKDFYERFSEAFLAEAQDFVDCIVSNKQPRMTAQDGTKATEVGFAMTQSFGSGTIISL
ncbi:MAG TPA: Gfo/Idh/MocA family oxidoreductase [Spirochaetales bacterium]|nr:Gfo/Idh/MocA family oxidoreductase [Spirochaetales bacterium]